MKVLVVEDNGEKLRQVMAAIGRGGCPDADVHVAYDIRQAKQLLRQHCYDLMVLDFVIPLHPSEQANPDGGVGLLRELHERDMFNVPREVVGLTAYEPISENAAELFATYTWSIVLYDPSSELWADQLARKVSHLLLSERSEEPLSFECHACILTALEKELDAVLRLPWNWQEYSRSSDVSMYWRGELKRRGELKTVYAATAPRMGITATAILATKMIEALRPEFLVMTGIAAGLKGECEIGDIIAADPTWNWESGKYAVIEGSPTFSPAPHQLPLHSAVRLAIERLAKQTARLDQIKQKWPADKPAAAIRLLIGPVASGASVLADPAKLDAIERQHRKLLGVEMESYGLYSAATESRVPQPLAVSLKAVSDFADAAKGDEFQKYASFVSAEAMKVLLEEFL